MFITSARLMGARAGSASLVTGDVALHSLSQPRIKAHSRTRNSAPPTAESTFVLAPTALALGGKEPAVLEGRFDATGYTLHLSGMASSARLIALGTALPEFGDGLAKVLPVNHTTVPVPVDLTATRPWGGVQVWTAEPAHPAIRRSRRE